MRTISYSIFGSRETPADQQFVFRAYLRGLSWNARMNRLIYPDFQTIVETDSGTFSDYDNVFYGLADHYGVHFNINETMPLCKSMLWRLKPIFVDGMEYVFCRDTDALTTYRESISVNKFIESGLILHGLSDNPAHSVPLMGGMCGFKCAPIREKYGTWENLLSLSAIEINERGTDQQFLNSVVYPEFKNELFSHYGPTVTKIKWEFGKQGFIESDKNNPLWLSDLCCFFIGAAGVNDLETIRFMKRLDNNTGFIEIEKRYPHIFYWHL